MKKIISILPWDWIWPEVMDQALRVLDKISCKYWHVFEYNYWLIWWSAYDKFKSHFPDETKVICKQSDAILFWSVWWPVEKQMEDKWRNCETNSILALRKIFNFNANFRPVKVYPELINICPLKKEIINKWIDMLIIRELVWDIYFGEHKTSISNWKRNAIDVAEYNEDQILSIANIAFKASKKRNKKLISVDKANVLDTSKLWRMIVDEVSLNYPDVSYSHILVDNCAMQLIKSPDQFDVILTPNMFWDILSDAAAVLPWSLGLLPSASLNEEGFWMYEPSWWSAPDIAWKNIANPIAQILSLAMMLKFSFNLTQESNDIENAISLTLKQWFRTWDIFEEWNIKLSTKDFTDKIIENIIY